MYTLIQSARQYNIVSRGNFQEKLYNNGNRHPLNNRKMHFCNVYSLWINIIFNIRKKSYFPQKIESSFLIYFFKFLIFNFHI